MPIVPISPPQSVPVFGGFDYVTIDTARRRVYAAHTGSRALLIVDADSGAVVGQVRVGAVHGVAVDPASGHVFTGNGTDRSISEIDPETQKVLRSVDVDGEVDAIAFDPANGRIYADEDDGTRVFVIEAASMTSIGTVALPGHKPEYLAIDPVSHELYQNISDLAEVAIVDPVSLSVRATKPTREIAGNHPLQYDTVFRQLLIGGLNGTIAAYRPDGTLLGKAAIQDRVDQCSLDSASHLIACAGSGKLSVLRDVRDGAPVSIGTIDIPKGAHTVGLDPKTLTAWIVWAQPEGDFVRGFRITP